MTGNPHNPAMNPHAWTSDTCHTALAVEGGKIKRRGEGGDRKTEINQPETPLKSLLRSVTLEHTTTMWCSTCGLTSESR